MGKKISFEHRLGSVRLVDRNEFLLTKSVGKKVLHLGCVDSGLLEMKIEQGQLLHLQLVNVASEVWGVDLDKEGLEYLCDRGINNLICGDVECLDKIEPLRGQKFDIIIAGELIEHLANPGMFLESCKIVMTPASELIITTPNALLYSRFLFALLGREAMHPDHVLLFTPTTLRTLLNKMGYEITEFYVYGGGPCVRFKPHESLARKMGRILLRGLDAVILNTIVRLQPWLNSGLIVVARLRG
jgi:2-polyprenyl-3-methyl-5-hydroxy-6-metoxy-1,4-benzoquinol methylase